MSLNKKTKAELIEIIEGFQSDKETALSDLQEVSNAVIADKDAEIEALKKGVETLEEVVKDKDVRFAELHEAYDRALDAIPNEPKHDLTPLQERAKTFMFGSGRKFRGVGANVKAVIFADRTIVRDMQVAKEYFTKTGLSVYKIVPNSEEKTIELVPTKF